jgi:hypothetical protein
MMAKKITEQELEVLESGVEGKPMSRVQVLESELKELENEKKIMEIEKGLHHLMEEIHPSKRAQATQALKSVLGGLKQKHESESHSERREKVKEGLKKGVGEIVKFLREEKAKKMGGTTPSGFTLPAKYYEKALGSGWGEKEKTIHRKHHAKVAHHKKHRRYASYSAFERMPARAMYYPRARRTMPWEEY